MQTLDIICKFCGSGKHIVRYGTYKGIQRYFCRNCERKFSDTDSPEKMRYPSVQISSAITMFYEGMSESMIQRHLQQVYGTKPSTGTIHEWIVKYTKQAINKLDRYVAKTCNTWIADETVLQIGGYNVWFWDIIDDKSRFLLASHISFTRTTKHAETFLLKAFNHADCTPDIIITDKLNVYLQAVSNIFGKNTKHLTSKGFTVQPNTNMIERFHSTLKFRTKIMRGLKSIETAQLFLDGWLIHYNFFRPHSSLKGRTPAEVARIEFPYKSWSDIVNFI